MYGPKVTVMKYELLIIDSKICAPFSFQNQIPQHLTDSSPRDPQPKSHFRPTSKLGRPRARLLSQVMQHPLKPLPHTPLPSARNRSRNRHLTCGFSHLLPTVWSYTATAPPETSTALRSSSPSLLRSYPANVRTTEHDHVSGVLGLTLPTSFSTRSSALSIESAAPRAERESL